MKAQSNILAQQDLTNLPKPFLFHMHGLVFAELIEIIFVLLSGVNPLWGKHGYNASLIIDHYNQLYELWRKLYRQLELDKLQIGQFKEFLELETDLSYSIKMWELSKESYREDKQILERHIEQPYPVPEDLGRLFEEVEKILLVYQTQKEYLQELSDLQSVYVYYHLLFNYQQGTFLYQGNMKEFQPGINEFQFLKILLDNRERIVTYDEIYKAMNKKRISTIDPKDEIKQIRKNLRKQLLFIGISSTETDFMLSKIVAKTNLGYILS